LATPLHGLATEENLKLPTDQSSLEAQPF
jgi:hypothetical protein